MSGLPPLSKVWHVMHFFADSAPRVASAFTRSSSSGTSGCVGVVVPPPGGGVVGTSISKPGLTGLTGAKTAPAAILSATTPRQVPRMAPRILFSSKESNTGQSPAQGRWGEMMRCGGTDNRFASPLATRITGAPTIDFQRVLGRRRGHSRMTDSNVLIVIPARMAATRLPGKPLADIAGDPMIVHVL